MQQPLNAHVSAVYSQNIVWLLPPSQRDRGDCFLLLLVSELVGLFGVMSVHPKAMLGMYGLVVIGML